MQKPETIDWSTELKEIPVREWKDRFSWVEEPYVSPDGDTIASIVNLEEGVFSVCENGEPWDVEYEKAWCLRPLPDGRFGVCACQDEEWTLSIGGVEWENRFDFIWDFKTSRDGSCQSLSVQKDMAYSVAVNDCPWPRTYQNINGTVVSDTGSSAAVVQVTSMAAADIAAYKSGLFSCAVNGNAIEKKFLNIWDISFDPAGENVAYGARIDRISYNVVVNDTPWDTTFQSVWKPEFLPDGQSVVAPVKIGGKWMLYKDGKPFWKQPYAQLWKLAVSQTTGSIAAVTSREFGKWSVTRDEKTWEMTVDMMISDLVFSEDGSTLVAVVKDKGVWDLAVNGKKWNLSADMVFYHTVSRDGSITAVAFQKAGQYFLAVNNRKLNDGYDYMAAPVIREDNAKILLRAVKGGIYLRKVLSVGMIL